MDNIGNKKVFFTSDLHLGHANVIKHCNRPFESLDHMNEALISNWNEVVSERDDVYILGDFCWGGVDRADAFVKRLKGNKFAIIGNHDKGNLKGKNLKNFIWVKTRATVKVADIDVYHDTDTKRKSRHIVLDHFPLLTWERKHYGVWHFHGHQHSTSPRPSDIDVPRIDVGVDAWGYYPVEYSQIKEYILGKQEVEDESDGDDKPYWIKDLEQKRRLWRIEQTKKADSGDDRWDPLLQGTDPEGPV